MGTTVRRRGASLAAGWEFASAMVVTWLFAAVAFAAAPEPAWKAELLKKLETPLTLQFNMIPWCRFPNNRNMIRGFSCSPPQDFNPNRRSRSEFHAGFGCCSASPACPEIQKILSLESPR